MTAPPPSYFKHIMPAIIACVIALSATTGHARPVAVMLYPNDAKITEQTAVDLAADGDAYSAQFFLSIHAVKDTMTVNTAPSDNLWITSRLLWAPGCFP